MTDLTKDVTPPTRCAIYTRKSSDEGLEQDFNSLDAQREAAEAFIASQRSQGWLLLPDRYDDGGFTGGNMERPALQRLMADIEADKVDCVVVYKVDRLSRSLLDFSRIIEVFDRHQVGFISVTQHLNTGSSMGRLTLHILLSFAQFEREMTAERIRDKVAAAKKKGKHCGGVPILGYDTIDGRLVLNEKEADLVRHVFTRFLQLGSGTLLVKELNAAGYRTKVWTTRQGKRRPGRRWDKGHLYRLLNNRKVIGEVTHRGEVYPGEHDAIVSRALWDKVHAILAKSHRARAGKTRAQTPALLAGLVTCAHCGKGMGVTFTRRRGRLYRYYVCVRAVKESYDACPVRSVSAGVLEKTVMDQLRRVFRAPEILARVAHRAKNDMSESEVRQALCNVDTIWDELFPVEQARVVQLLVKDVVVRPDGIDVRVRADGLHSLVAEISDTAQRRAG